MEATASAALVSGSASLSATSAIERAAIRISWLRQIIRANTQKNTGGSTMPASIQARNGFLDMSTSAAMPPCPLLTASAMPPPIHRIDSASATKKGIGDGRRLSAETRWPMAWRSSFAAARGLGAADASRPATGASRSRGGVGSRTGFGMPRSAPRAGRSVLEAGRPVGAAGVRGGMVRSSVKARSRCASMIGAGGGTDCARGAEAVNGGGAGGTESSGPPKSSFKASSTAESAASAASLAFVGCVAIAFRASRPY